MCSLPLITRCNVQTDREIEKEKSRGGKGETMRREIGEIEAYKEEYRHSEQKETRREIEGHRKSYNR